MQSKLPNKIKMATVLDITDTSYASIRQMVKDNRIHEPEKIGRESYFDTVQLYKDISVIAGGREIKIGEKLKSSVSLQKLFNRSSAWVWLHLQKNKSMKEKAVYLNSRPSWIMGDILADKELAQYLAVLEGEVQRHG